MNRFHTVLFLLSILIFSVILTSIDPIFAQIIIKKIPEELKDLPILTFYCVDDSGWPICLKVNPTTIPEGKQVNFIGTYLSNYNIRIIDRNNGNVVTSTTSDSDGNFFISWDVPYTGNKTYEFYASAGGGEFPDRSNIVTLEVLRHTPPTLIVSDKNPFEGDNIIFSGEYVIGGIPQINEEIQIIDQTNNETIKTVQTNSNGKYQVQWKAKYNDGMPYKFYAKATSSKINNTSEAVSILVYRTLFKLTASPTDVFDGKIVSFSGEFLVNEKPVPNIPITILEKTHGISIDAKTTDADGKFFAKWQAEYGDNNTYEFYAMFEIPYYSPESTFMVAPMYESRSFESNSVIIQVLDYVAPDILLTLDPLPAQVIEGESITFSGILKQTQGDLTEPLYNQTICIVNNYSKEIIVSSDTDINGRYSISWTVVYQEKQPFVFYAVSYDDCNSYEYSTEFKNPDEYEYYKSQVRQTRLGSEPVLTLDKIPSVAHVGDILILKGSITEDRFFGERVLIKANGTAKTTDNLDDNKMFSTAWQIKSYEIGKYEIYAECSCNGYDLKSNSFDIIVVNDMQQLTSQITSDKTSGITNDVISFSSRVSGGIEPYSYEWSINGKETSYETSTISSKFPEPGEYKIVFTVTDSLGAKSSDDITIKIQDKATYPNDFINVNGMLLEGSQITFSVADDYPIPIKSYYWEFHDGTDSVDSVVSKTFDDNGNYAVKLLVLDQNDQSNISTTTVEISNVEPKINNIEKFSHNIVAQEPIVFEASFNDPGTADTFVVEWFLDSNIIPLYSENKDRPSFVTLSHKFSDPGNYKISLAITDDDGGQVGHVFPVKVEKEEEFPWVIIVAILVACGVGGGIAINYIKSKPNIPTQQNPNTGNNPENNDVKKQPSIDMDIEFSSGIEKK